MKKPTEKFDVRQFVPKTVYDKYGQNSWWFISDNIVKLADFTESFFETYFKGIDLTIEDVKILINDYHVGGKFENRGLRTVDYINSQLAKGVKTAKLSQHVGGSTNAIDFNIVLVYKGGRQRVLNSDEVWDIIFKNQEVFMAAGLTTLEDKSITKGWTHADCRFTGLDKLLIVKP